MCGVGRAEVKVSGGSSVACAGPAICRPEPAASFPPGKDPKDHEKENLRRIREIQRRFREQERSREQGQPRPLKALWRSPKYDKVESRVKALLQVAGREPEVLSDSLATADYALVWVLGGRNRTG